MDLRTLDIKVISARGLNDLNLLTKMDVYVVVSLISDDSHCIQTFRTYVNKNGGVNPNWDSMMKFTIKEADANLFRQHLIFRLLSESTLGADKVIGETKVPLKELLDAECDDSSFMKYMTYQVIKSSGKAQGVINFSFKFGARFGCGASPAMSGTVDPVIAYPSPLVCPNAVNYCKPYYAPQEVYPPPTIPESPYYYRSPPQEAYHHPPTKPDYHRSHHQEVYPPPTKPDFYWIPPQEVYPPPTKPDYRRSHHQEVYPPSIKPDCYQTPPQEVYPPPYHRHPEEVYPPAKPDYHCPPFTPPIHDVYPPSTAVPPPTTDNYFYLSHPTSPSPDVYQIHRDIEYKW